MRILAITQDELGTPIDPDLFARVGEEFGIGATLTYEYYYNAKKALG